jgi:uridine kinase
MFAKLEEYIKNNSNKVIAIDGPSGAGKSSLARKLAADYDVLIIHTDDYFLHPQRKTTLRLNETGGNLDYERLEKELFSCLNNKFIQSNYFNCQTNELEFRMPIKRKSIIIVEGVYSLHPLFVKYYDYKVFIDVDRISQLQRILARSGEKLYKKFVKEWIPLEDKYFAENELKYNVDLYISNY